MKKSKFVKAVAAFTMSAVAAVGCISLAACGHSHHTSESGWQGWNENQHWHICDDDDEAFGHQNHNWGDDDICDDCGYDRATGTVDPDGPGDESGEESGDEDYDAFVNNDDVIYKNTFNKVESVPFIPASEVNTATGIYGSVNNDATAFTEANNVVIAGEEGSDDLQLRAIDTETSNTTSAFVRITPVSYKIVKIYAKVIPGSLNSKWTHVSFLDANGSTLAQVRANGDSKLQVFEGSDTSAGLGNEVSYSAGQAYKLEATIDLVNGVIAVSVDGTAITTLEGAEAKVTSTSFSGIKIATASGARNIYIDNFAVRAQDPATADLKAVFEGQLDELYETLTATEGAYTDENAAVLEQKYEDGIAAINAATTNDAVISAYQAAVADLNAVETKAATALREFKEDRVAALESWAEENSGSYTINATEFDEAVENGINAINAATVIDTEAEPEVKGVWMAYNSALTALNAIDKDEAALAHAKTEAKTEVEEYVDAEKYLDNEEELQGVINQACSDIDAVQVEGGDYVGAVEAIDVIVAQAKADIDEIPTDAELAAEAKENALAELATYKNDEIADIDAGEFPTITQQIQDKKTNGIAEINALTRAGEVEEKLAQLKADIDYLIKSTTQTVADAKIDAKAMLEEHANAAIAKLDQTADAELISKINQAKTAGETAIDAVSDDGRVAEVNEALEEAKDAIDALVAADALVKHKVLMCAELEAHAELKKSEILSNEYKAKIDAAVVEEKEKINAAETTVAVDEAYDAAREVVDGLETECKTATFTVTFANTSLTNGSVTYGTSVVQPSNPTKEDAKFLGWYADEALTKEYEFSGVVYDDVTIYAKFFDADVTLTFMAGGNTVAVIKGFSGDTLETLPEGYVSAMKFDHWELSGSEFTTETELTAGNHTLTAVTNGYKTNEELENGSVEWAAAATETVSEGVIKDSGLFVVTTTDTQGAFYDIINTGGKTAASINNKEFNCGYYTGNITTGSEYSKLNPIKITAKENVKLTVYVGLAGSNSSDGRTGTISYAKGETVVEIAKSTSNTRLLGYAEIELKAGETVNIYGENAGSSGARLWLFGIDAVIGDDFVNATIATNVEGTVTNLGWNSLKPVTAPAAPIVEGKSFKYWSATENGEEYAYGSNLTVGETLTLYAVFETADVTVNFYDEDGTTLLASVGAVSGSPFDTSKKPADPEKEGYIFVGWYTGTAEDATVYDFATSLTAGTLNLYAKFEVKPLQDPWKIDFTQNKPSSNLTYKDGDVIANELTVVTSANSNWNKEGYLKASADSVFSFEIAGPATLTITDANSNSARYYIVTDSDGNEICKHIMKNTSETITLSAAGTYYITAYVGECRIGSIELSV